MPFTKIGKDKYQSPSGRVFNKKQVQMYYATEGFTKKAKGSRRGEKTRGRRGIRG